MRGGRALLIAGLVAGGLLSGCAAGGGSATVVGLRAQVFAPPPSADAGEFRVAAPTGCTDLLPCLGGLARAYGVDLTAELVPSDDPVASLDALLHGEVDLAVLPAAGAEAGDSRLVLLEDDRQALKPDHLVLTYRKELAWLYGPSLQRDLELIGGALTDGSFSRLYQRRAHQGVGEAASEWLSTVVLPAPSAVALRAPALLIGGWGGPELQMTADALAGALTRLGYPAVQQRSFSSRAEAVQALAGGSINVLPDYSASLLAYLNGGRAEASADPVRTTARLGEYLDQFGARTSAAFPGTAAMVFAVDARTASLRSLRRLSDLRSVATVKAAPPAAAAPDTGPPTLAVALRAERHSLAVGDLGPEVAAIQARLHQVGYALEPDGSLTGPTVAALQAFEAARGLPSTSSVVDDRTRRALERAPARASGPPPERVVYLTYDDGPDPTFTPAILDLLDQYGARASFFQVGTMVEHYPRVAAEVVRRGHAVGNHTAHHADLRRAPDQRVQSELVTARDAILAATGVTTACMRPPYGAVDQRVRAVTGELGMTPVLWNVDTVDWSKPGVDAIVQSVLDGSKAGAVILMHDGGTDRSQTVHATQRILAELSARGYGFESLPQC